MSLTCRNSEERALAMAMVVSALGIGGKSSAQLTQTGTFVYRSWEPI